MTENRKKVRVTPRMAATWLRQVPERQRNVRQAQVTQWAREMAEGRWVYTLAGTPLAFNTRSEMIQGQHRLHAVIRSKTTQYFDVVFDVPDEVVFNLDIGIKRSPGDILTMAGFKNATNVSTLIGNYHWYEADFQGSPNALTPTEMRLFAEKHDALLQDAVQSGRRARNDEPRLNLAGLSAAMFAIRLHGADDALIKPFEHILATGISPIENHPAARLRKKLARMGDRDRSGNVHRVLSRDTICLFLVAWNRYLEGDTRNFNLPKEIPGVQIRVHPNNPFFQE